MADDWRKDLDAWLVPFLSALGHTARARMCPPYGAELTILPDGGHIWLGHDEEIAQRMHRFLTLSV